MRLSLVLFAALVAIPAWAHHSFGATFDANKPVTITGVLTKVQWTNPQTTGVCIELEGATTIDVAVAHGRPCPLSAARHRQRAHETKK